MISKGPNDKPTVTTEKVQQNARCKLDSPPEPSKDSLPKVKTIENVKLVQDLFGYYYKDDGTCEKVKRFTWTNRNLIEVQVINYGARIISIKYPDRKGEIDDIVLGFDDLAGYIHYKNYYFGATIGRVTNIIKNASFSIGEKDYRLKPNTRDGHNFNGGPDGFDQKVWKTFVRGKKVIMTHLSPNGDQGFPGYLLVKVTFELSPVNEFYIQMTAHTTKPTLVNLSNLTYLNLAGHQIGPEGTYRSVVTMNCNYYTKKGPDGCYTGEIANVARSPFDFQVAKSLGKVCGIDPGDGYYQNLCINKSGDNDDAFVARIIHAPSGRLLEVYSNQYGIQIDTCNQFGASAVLSFHEIFSVTAADYNIDATEDISLKIIDALHIRMLQEARGQEETYYLGFRNFIQRLKKSSYRHVPLMPRKFSTMVQPILNSAKPSRVSIRKSSTFFEDDLANFTCTSEQMNYLKTLHSVVIGECINNSANWLVEVLEKLIFFGTKNAERAGLIEAILNRTDTQSTIDINQIPLVFPTEKALGAEHIILEERKKSVQPDSKSEKKKAEHIPLKIPKITAKKNYIPSYYESTNEIIGKQRILYKRHGGIAFQTQNYPDAANIDTFPSCVLNPGETYVHNIEYKFWIRSGNPSRWYKRNIHEIGLIHTSRAAKAAEAAKAAQEAEAAQAGADVTPASASKK